MKRKSEMNATTPSAKPKKPFVRNVKWRGEIVELAFLAKAASMGFAVTKPYGDSEPYDFIVDSGSRLWRVQVKSGSYKTGSAYRVGVHHLSNTKPKQKAYTAKQIDILAVYIVPLGVWYIIPMLAFTPSTSLAFLPDTPETMERMAENMNNSAKPGSLACRRAESLKTGSSPRRRAITALSGRRALVCNKVKAARSPLYCFFSIFAQVSFNATVRLKTGLLGVESGSAQKYPRRSNW